MAQKGPSAANVTGRKKIISAIIYLRCPHCQGSQYRRSVYDINVKNPLGAKCIFCKSAMIQINPQPMAA